MAGTAGTGSYLDPCAVPRITGNGGPRSWRMQRDIDGERTYKLRYRVFVDPTIGPYQALYTPGLPMPGSSWNVGTDVDDWAFCTQEADVTPVAQEGEPNNDFDIDLVFTTKATQKCAEIDTTDPLLRADIVSGSFIRYTKEVTTDRFGEYITTSAFEQLTGPKVEFDANRPQVRVQQNVATLDLDTLCQLMDTVNLLPQWGFAERCVKLSGCSWEKKYAADCTVYYARTLEFDIDTTSFDRELLDIGTKVLHGQMNPKTGTWELLPVGFDPDLAAIGPNFGFVYPDPANPLHFDRYQDSNGNMTKVILNGAGIPWDPNHATTGTDDDVEGKIQLEYYFQRDWSFLVLPATL